MSDQRLELILDQLHPEPGTKLWHGGATLVGALNEVLKGLYSKKSRKP